MKKGFTMAEVLITLAIIGIVAVLTVPTLVQSYKKQIATTRLKKFYSTMQQAIALSEIENNSAETWTRGAQDLKDTHGQYDYNANAQSVHDFFMKYLAPYMNYIKVIQTPEKRQKSMEASVYLADGSMIYMHNGGCVDFNYDINGEVKPNQYGRDIFAFAICEKKTIRFYIGGQKFGALYYMHPSIAPDRNTALTSCTSDAAVCSTLLMFDNWEFKDDYPYKL